jgi:copper chaperone
MSQTQTYTVTGMTCGHCVASVTEEVQEIPGVPGGALVREPRPLTLSREQAIEDAAVKAAVEEAGYQLG